MLTIRKWLQSIWLKFTHWNRFRNQIDHENTTVSMFKQREVRPIINDMLSRWLDKWINDWTSSYKCLHLIDGWYFVSWETKCALRYLQTPIPVHWRTTSTCPWQLVSNRFNSAGTGNVGSALSRWTLQRRPIPAQFPQPQGIAISDDSSWFASCNLHFQVAMKSLRVWAHFHPRVVHVLRQLRSMLARSRPF